MFRVPSKAVLLNAVVAIVTGLLVVVAVAFWNAPEATKVKVGDVAPDLRLPTVGGGPSSLSAYRGKPILLVFFQSNCGICNEEIPQIEQLNRRFRPRGLVVMGVAVDVDKDALQQFLDDHGVTFIVMHDPDAVELRRVYGSYKMPEAYLLDRDGRVVRIYLGRAHWRTAEAIVPIQRLVGIRVWPPE